MKGCQKRYGIYNEFLNHVYQIQSDLLIIFGGGRRGWILLNIVNQHDLPDDQQIGQGLNDATGNEGDLGSSRDKCTGFRKIPS